MSVNDVLCKEKGFTLEISGDYACFTRPEMKVERVTYDVITPSAARAIFEAILWKPQIRWNIRQIKVLNAIQYVNIKRNEIGKRMTDKNGLFIDENRQQRAGVILKDVKYHIDADFDLIDSSEKPHKYVSMFARRAGRGQCYYRPYLGCREFSCNFKLIAAPTGTYSRIENDADDFNGDYSFQAKEIDKLISDNRDLGYMLYDMDYKKDKNGKVDITPLYYHARMIDGIIKVPHKDSDKVKR